MIDPNKEKMIYYGTDITYLEEIDSIGMKKPRFREEQYISVSVSGYQGVLPCEHPDLYKMAKEFSEILHVATFQNNFLHYKTGYRNSLTCFQGFGVCPNTHIHTFDGLKLNTQNSEKLTVVISDKAYSLLRFPDKKYEFQYLSLAVHSFLLCIRPEDIMGYIVSDENYEWVQDLKKQKKWKNKEIWKGSNFKETSF